MMNEKWKVIADHPVSARADKYGLSRQEATAYADSLRPLGYENISIILQDTPTSDERPVVNDWTKLYHAVNLMMCQLGAEGTISTRERQSSDVMDALFEIDGGAYNEQFQHEPDLQQAVELIMGYEDIYFIFTKDRLALTTTEEVVNLIQGEKG